MEWLSTVYRPATLVASLAHSSSQQRCKLSTSSVEFGHKLPIWRNHVAIHSPPTGLLAPAFLPYCCHYQEGSCNCYCSIHSFNAAFPPFLHKQPSINHLRRSLRRPTRSALQLQSLLTSPHSPSQPTRALLLVDQSSAPLFQHYPLAVLTNPSML